MHIYVSSLEDDNTYILTRIGFSIYKSYYVSNQRREICDFINILVREIKCILFHEKNDRIRKILKYVLQVLLITNIKYVIHENNVNLIVQ